MLLDLDGLSMSAMSIGEKRSQNSHLVPADVQPFEEGGDSLEDLLQSGLALNGNSICVQAK